ncbi:TMEM175 family protein [Sphingomonas nostoxanthinifaciens]|uniref:TMEM175 family protein n=1 Tax=Sphingomonas nostoxanthinifaciens TaxID=2872652 RepID=UPI001CC20143|nr:TMEM175 family protein [Sphingomonas nostoxanthinifaciens]UAK25164.1 DUF1211 domain-containing protein [Sphingomonas nostoxanthinifaciens]
MNHRLLERLVFFSDAVFAIVITLLVIEIDAPRIPLGPDATHAAWEALGERLPKFVGFVLSFWVVGSFWALHHRAFGLVEGHDRAFLWPNLLLLMAIAFVPFSTAFMSENMGQTVPHLFYLLTLLAAALLQARLIYRVLRPEHAAAGVAAEELLIVRRRVWALPAAVVIALLLVPLSPGLANTTLFAVPLLARLMPRLRFIG